MMAGLDGSDLAHRFVDRLTDYAIVMVDAAGKILTWNAGAQALLGYAADEVVGRNFGELYSRLDPTTTEATAAITADVPWSRRETNRELVRKDGSRLEANIVLKRIMDGNRTVGFGLIAHDIDRSRRIAAALPAPPASAAAPAHGKAKVLVVDDNQRVLGIAVDQLTSLGYRVTWASSGEEALEMLRRDDDIDLLFTDVVMPGELAGGALAAKAMEIRPGLRVLFSSGYFEGTLVGKGQIERDVQFLAKPYRKHELARKIEEVLSSTG
jgi:PAS domain S-box-containing protein